MKFRRIASFFREIGGSSTGFSKDWRRGELVECGPCTAPKGLIIDPPYDVSGKVEYDKEYNGCNSEVGEDPEEDRKERQVRWQWGVEDLAPGLTAPG